VAAPHSLGDLPRPQAPALVAAMSPRVLPTPTLTEKQWQAQVIAEARRFGWWCFHPHDSRRSAPGWPDLALAHPGRRLFLLVELKTDTGRLRPEQRQAIDVLRSAGVRVEIWRPSMVDRIWPFITGRTDRCTEHVP